MFSRALLFVIIIALTACDPAYNPYMALNKEAWTTGTPSEEHEVYFSESVSDVYEAILIAGNKDGLHVSQTNAQKNIVVIEYPFSMIKSVWGGRFNVNLDSIDGKTRLVAQFYEKSNPFVVGSLFNPFIGDLKLLLSPSIHPSS